MIDDGVSRLLEYLRAEEKRGYLCILAALWTSYHLPRSCACRISMEVSGKVSADTLCFAANVPQKSGIRIPVTSKI